MTDAMADMVASVTSLVFDFPPRSGVTMPCSDTSSTAFISTLAASSSPSHASISEAVQKVPIGFAIPLPVISNADPWIGSNIEGCSRVGSRLLVGAMPMEPANAAARSEMMSAC